MEMLKTDQLILEFEHTAYDDDMLGGKTIRIKSIKPLVPIKELTELEPLLKDNGIVLAQYRMPATDLPQRKLVYKLGFYYISTVVELWLDDLQNRNFTWGSEVRLRQFNYDRDLLQIKNITENNFEHGAFFEDPFLRHLATERFHIILSKYASTKDWQFILMENNKGKLVSWAIWHWDDQSAGKARAELLGTDQSMPRLGTYVANAMFNDMKQQGANYVQLNITISNTPIATIYLRLGFHFLPPTEIYHIYTVREY